MSISGDLSVQEAVFWSICVICTTAIILTMIIKK